MLYKYFIGCVLAGFLSTYALGQQADLTIEISNIQEVKGEIQIAVFGQDGQFLKAGEEYSIERVKVKGKKVVHVLANLPHGDYALAFFQDVNEDGTLNTNFIGIPKEPYAFSNNFRPMFKAPSFVEAKVKVQGDTKINIELIQ